MMIRRLFSTTVSATRRTIAIKRVQCTSHRRIELFHSTRFIHNKKSELEQFIEPYSNETLIHNASVNQLLSFINECFERFDMNNTPKLYPTIYQCLVKCAKEKNVDALSMLGNMYVVGTLGVEQNIEIAFKYYLEAAELGHAQSQFYVARLYFNAFKILLDEDISSVNFQPDLLDELTFEPKVVESEEGYVFLDEKAQRKLQLSEQLREKTDYSTLPGLSNRSARTKLKENRKIGMDYLQRAAHNGYSKAQLLLSRMYMEGGPGLDANTKRGFEWLERAAESGEAQAYYNIGIIYYSGLSATVPKEGTEDLQLTPEEKANCYVPFIIEKDVNKAIEYFFKAAELDDPVATYWIGYSYIHGQHLEKDVKKGVKLVEKACQLGHPQAFYYMFLAYTEGNEVIEKNPILAEEMFQLAVEANSSDAYFDLADRVFHGTFGEKKDLERALKLYEQAGRQGHADALLCLGTMYYHGLGTEKDLRTAYERYSQAVTAGSQQALLPLARMTMKGEGVEASEEYGQYLMGLAQKAGLEIREEDFR
jgi:TPR repeat protein